MDINVVHIDALTLVDVNVTVYICIVGFDVLGVFIVFFDVVVVVVRIVAVVGVDVVVLVAHFASVDIVGVSSFAVSDVAVCESPV